MIDLSSDHGLMLNNKLLFCFVIVLFASCRNNISEIKAITDAQNLPVQTSMNVIYEYTEKGKIRNKLTAGQLDQYEGEDGYMEASSGFTMIFFDSLENESARLSAVHGKYFQKDNRMIAWEKVELFNTRNEKLETEELLFEQDSSRISTGKFVTITTQSGIIYGNGLESNESFTKYHILQPTGNLYVNEKKDSTLNGKSK